MSLELFLFTISPCNWDEANYSHHETLLSSVLVVYYLMVFDGDCIYIIYCGE